MKRVNHKARTGLILVIAGLALWLVPFVLVIIDNIIGSTKPADSLINSFGLLLITVSPILVISGLVLIAAGSTKRTKA